MARFQYLISKMEEIFSVFKSFSNIDCCLNGFLITNCEKIISHY